MKNTRDYMTFDKNIVRRNYKNIKIYDGCNIG